MARVSISEAARLVKVSRPTIYKMINSGKLSYTSVVKHGKLKVIDTSELIRVFGSLDGVIDTVKYDVKVTQNLQVLTALVYMIYNIESLT
jgi:excisionase family DNA binding protein